MWGAEGSKVFTIRDGWAWVFAAVDHFNAECVGRHTCKKGDRFNALEPISQGLLKNFGSLQPQVARGLSLRIDAGSQYLSRHFQNQIQFRGIAPSFAFIEQPQTNGVVERFFRTLKEQIVYGRTYLTVEELRVAVDKFVELYNQEWRIERLGFISKTGTGKLLDRPRKMRLNSVQKTGCDTILGKGKARLNMRETSKMLSLHKSILRGADTPVCAQLRASWLAILGLYASELARDSSALSLTEYPN